MYFVSLELWPVVWAQGSGSDLSLFSCQLLLHSPWREDKQRDYHRREVK